MRAQEQIQIPASGRAFRFGYAQDDKTKTLTRYSLLVTRTLTKNAGHLVRREDKDKTESYGFLRKPQDDN